MVYEIHLITPLTIFIGFKDFISSWESQWLKWTKPQLAKPWQHYTRGVSLTIQGAERSPAIGAGATGAAEVDLCGGEGGELDT